MCVECAVHACVFPHGGKCVSQSLNSERRQSKELRGSCIARQGYILQRCLFVRKPPLAKLQIRNGMETTDSVK